MTRPSFSVEGLRRRTEVPVDRAWNARILAGVEQRVRRRQMARRATVGVAAMLLLGGATLWRLSLRERDGGNGLALRAPAGPASAPGDTSLIAFDDGATGRLVSAASRAEVTQRSSARTTVTVQSGAVGFDVAHTGREFRVEAGAVHVLVVGTAFVVDRRADGVAVSVQRGRVRVEAHGETVALGVGERRWFPTSVPAPPVTELAEAAPPTPTAAPRPEPPVAHGAPRRAPSRWTVLAQRGDFRRAYRLLRQPGAKPHDDVEELLLAADVARKSSHFAEAIPYYDRVIVSHAGDPRAALAALTKGRISLHQLGRPREAAVAFSQARALSLPDGLVEEALIGEATAWHRAGEMAKARATSAEYVRRYPHSPSVENVRRLGDPR